MFHRGFFSSSKRRRAKEVPGGTEAPSLNLKSSREDGGKNLGSGAALVGSGEYSRQHGTPDPSDHERQPRAPSDTSVPISSTNLSVRPKSRQRTPSRASDPLGLSLLYAPDGDALADIVFVHGLGGSSRLSWCMRHDLDLYWPLKWLPNDPDTQQTRIFTFGYNADFRSSSQSANLGISDFSKTLLFDMLYGTDQDGKPFNFGQRPVVFVTHSMGGLVFKKVSGTAREPFYPLLIHRSLQAYLDAQLDEAYVTVTASIKAVIFLATPHRGSDLSGILNKLLSISFRQKKQYVAELGKNGWFLQTINEQFRHLATRLQIFSFYETLQTSVGLSSTVIVDEDSGKLGYPGETSRPLNADHHGVCKFDTPEDPNYRAVLGALKSLVSSYSDNNTHSLDSQMQLIRSFLCIPEDPEHDLDYFWSRRAERTSDWILEQPQVRSWTSLPSASEILWLFGRPARGKSVLASFLVHHLREKGATVQHFFFRAGDETKGSIGALLRFLAFQIAAQLPAFRNSLVKLAGGGYKPKDADWKTTWKRLYVGLLFKLDSRTPLYWVIDALDESDAGQQVLDLLADIQSSATPVHVLVTSRLSLGLSTAFERLKSKLPSSMMSIDHNTTDMEIYVEEELQGLGWDPSVKTEVRNKIMDQANDNFLWVHLILEEIKECHTDDDVRATLSELPPGMESLYQRMETSIARIRRPFDKNLSRQLFLWATYARRPLSTEELRSLLESEFGQILDLENTINRLCGQFIAIESNNRIGLLHHTAREYLVSTKNLPFSLDFSEAHNELFQKSLSAFKDRHLRSQLSTTGCKYLQYRATSWVHHLKALSSSEGSDNQLDMLVKFFGEGSFLTWVQALASLGHLNVLIEASHCLSSLVKQKRRTDNARDPNSRQFRDLELLDLWSRDLLKLPGRFGSCLSLDPTSIHHCIAPLCPRDSVIFRTFGANSSVLSVKGSPEDWDNCLARVFVGNEHPASVLCCSSRYLAVVNTIGTLFIWDCTIFHLLHTISHGEIVFSATFNASGDRLATYGSRTTKVWDPQSGLAIYFIDNPPEIQPLFLEFLGDDTGLIVGSDRRSVLQTTFLGEQACWKVLDEELLNDDESLEGTYLNCPTALAISPDHSKIAAAYPRYPLTIWSVNPASVVYRLNRGYKEGQPSAASPFVNEVAWHPNGEEVIGLFLDGFRFKLDVVDGTYQETPPDQGHWPRNIRVSPDGTVFAISGVLGSIRLYDYQSSALIYQMASEDIMTAFCFSRDSRRFYDIRESSCGIWEPDALLRRSTAEDTPASGQLPDENIEQSNNTSGSFAANPLPVTLVSPTSGGSVVVLGDDDGLVELLDYNSGDRIQVDRIATRMAIEHLVWSEDNSHFAYAEVVGRITVVYVEATESGWKKRCMARFKPEQQPGGITQLLLSPDSRTLLVAFQQTVQLWCLEPVELRVIRTCSHMERPAKWAVHPQSPSHLLSMTPDECVVYTWSDLLETARWNISAMEYAHSAQTSKGSTAEQSEDNVRHPEAVIETVVKAIVTHFKNHILLTIARSTSQRQLPPRFLLLNGNIGLKKINDETTEAQIVQ
ncbi:hypothetical protein DL769_002129 [Monosporascus sp. CRB-8-3]|nr:hypothetical protein DL769_002129 [Monosporascus sp. CRB-8-3]